MTGASGGVGSIAVGVLANWAMKGGGYRAPRNGGVSQRLGASEIVAREEINETTKRPLEKKLGQDVDAVGGEMLARVLGQMKYGLPSLP